MDGIFPTNSVLFKPFENLENLGNLEDSGWTHLFLRLAIMF